MTTNQDQFDDDLKTSRESAGKKLLIAAWTHESMAASVGLSIAFATAYYASAMGGADTLTAITGAMPFLMVAVAELCKIPLAAAAYHSQRFSWRAIFTAGLIFLTVITFETMINGGERFFASSNHLIQELKTKFAIAFQDAEQKRRQIVSLKGVSAEAIHAEFAETTARIDASQENQLGQLSEQHAQDVERLTEGASDELPAEVRQLNDELARLDSRYQSERTRLEQAIEAQLDSVLPSQASARGLGTWFVIPEALNARSGPGLASSVLERFARGQTVQVSGWEGHWARISVAGSDPVWVHGAYLSPRNPLHQSPSFEAVIALRAEHEQQQAALRSSYQTERSHLVTQRDARLAEHRQKMAQRDGTLAKLNEAFWGKRTQVLSYHQEQQSQAKARYDQRMANVESRETKIASLDTEIANLERQQVEFEREMSRIADDNQIYRIAMLVYGHETPAEVLKDELKIVMAVWLVSIAAIVALTGPLLAFASFVLRYQKPKRPDTNVMRAKIRFLRSLRLLAVKWRRARTRTVIKTIVKEVTKDVVVTNTVVQRVEVPKIIERDRVVTQEVPKIVERDRVVTQEVPKIVESVVIKPVPFPTNDPNLLGIKRASRADDDDKPFNSQLPIAAE